MKVFDKYKDLSMQAKAVIWFTGCSFLQKGISFFTVPVFTRIMSSEQYGTYNVYLSWLQILTIFTSLYLFNGAFDNAMIKYQDRRDEYSSSMIGIILVLNLIIIGFYAFTSGVWESGTGLDQTFIIFMFIESFASSILSFWSARQRFEYKYISLVVATIIKSLLNPIIGIVFLLNFDGRAIDRIIGGTLVDCVVIIPLVIGQIKKSRRLCVGEFWKYALGMAIPAVPHYLAGTILNQGDRVMIDKMIGKPEVAYYGLAYSVGMLVQIFATGITAAITPWMYSNMKRKDIKGMCSRLDFLCVLLFFLIVFMIMISPELVKVFGTSEYESAKFVIPPVTASVFFVFLYGIYSLPEFYYERPKYLTIASIVSAVLNIFLNFIFLRIFGYIAAAYTTLVCYICYTIGHYIVGKRLLAKDGIFDEYLTRKLIITLAIMLFVILVMGNYLYMYNVIRCIVITLMVILAYVYRKKLMEEVLTLAKR